MNIKEAKEYILNTVKIYLKKDEYGDYRIPVVKQRPVFLLGAPGIGKTAIMEQIASELNIALVSYSMTHHTRQSALGLPYISKKEYAGETFDVSEYTMSEIIASIYETMKASEIKEGILFLDEINCVSETLAPSMLQFLQYKVFGRHSVPEGWVIVTAGNPVEFNKSVREFDVVTLDRLKVLNIEPDYPAWKQYATDKKLHSSILNFLESRKEYFYIMETTAAGKNYVTARGWEDLSDIIYAYEEEGLKVNENLVSQYIKHDKAVLEFCAYYDLYNKYKRSYKVEEIVEGNISDDIVKKASEAPIDERLSLVGILLDKAKEELKEVMDASNDLKSLKPSISAAINSENIAETLKLQYDARLKLMKNKQAASSLSVNEKTSMKRCLKLFEQFMAVEPDKDNISAVFNEKVTALKALTQKKKEHLHYAFEFVRMAFSENSNEMLVMVTELTMNKDCASFVATFGSEDYDKYNALLMVTDRNETLKEEILKFI